MKIFVTGGTGFIGSHFVNYAVEQNHSVIALRRRKTTAPCIQIKHQPAWLDADMSEVDSKYLSDSKVLVHLAAHTGNVPYDTLQNCLKWNLVSVLNLFEKARIAGVSRFIVAGSCFEYGRSGERYKEIPTNAPLEPTNSYAASKAAASISLLQWATEHNIRLEILRLFHVYGEGEPESRFWPSLRRAALAGHDFPMTRGEQIRDFLYVNDAASLFLSRACYVDTDISHPLIWNLGSGHHISIESFAHKLWSDFNAKGRLLIGHKPYRPGEVMRYVPGPSLLTPNSNTIPK